MLQWQLMNHKARQDQGYHDRMMTVLTLTLMLVTVMKTLTMILRVATAVTGIRSELCGDNRDNHEGTS